MQKVGSRELKNRLGRYLDKVRKGHSLLVTDRGKPVAKLTPVENGDEGHDALEERLDELARLGYIRRGNGGKLSPFKPVPIQGKPASQIIIEDRR